MKRFLILNFTNSFNLLVETMIKEKGYLQVENPYLGGDNDIIIIDTLDECWCYGENGSTLVNNYFLSKFENVNKLSGGDYITLENIIRYASKLDDCSDDYSDDIYLRNKSGEGRD